LSSTAFTTLKIAVFAPIPSAHRACPQLQHVEAAAAPSVFTLRVEHCFHLFAEVPAKILREQLEQRTV